MYHSDASEEPARLGSTCSKQTPGCGGKEDEFDQQAHDPGHADDRWATVAGDAECAPDSRGEEGKSDCEQETQRAVELCPAVITKSNERGKLKEEAEREVEGMLS